MSGPRPLSLAILVLRWPLERAISDTLSVSRSVTSSHVTASWHLSVAGPPGGADRGPQEGGLHPHTGEQSPQTGKQRQETQITEDIEHMMMFSWWSSPATLGAVWVARPGVTPWWPPPAPTPTCSSSWWPAMVTMLTAEVSTWANTKLPPALHSWN